MELGFSVEEDFEGEEVLWLEELLVVLSGVRLMENQRDRWVWLPGEEGVFSTNSSYSFLQEQTLEYRDPVFNLIWPAHVLSCGRWCWEEFKNVITCSRGGS